MAKRTPQPAPATPAAIDARSPELVLTYVGGPVPRDVPARDLHGGDLARIAYVRALFEARSNVDIRRPQGTPANAPLPHATRPKPATATQLEALAAELVASRAFTRITPEQPGEDPRPEPAAPDPVEPVTPAEPVAAEEA